ncbi:DUF1622 domain-containing protein [Miltoncostaea marina]|uniref:DUF1622 domain-containing protein n=1 Tax=Miltoncostaea marina TaxID=2843215 RepID=UPI001C3E0F6B|nr:DUF1622 domain-containing protein [Miltoncostaea marina]
MEDVLSEETLRDIVDVAVRLVELGGAAVIAVGASIAFVRVGIVLARRDSGPARFTPVRLDLGRFLALGLEFQLAGDILRTAIAPSFQQIGQLAAIAAIRTALNWFLRLEIRQERDELAEGARGAAGVP